MKRKYSVLLFITIGLIISGIGNYRAYADDGSLQLNNGMITGNNSGVGTVGDFPIRGELFLPQMNQSEESRVKNQDQIPQGVHDIDFRAKDENNTNKLAVKPVQDKLFHSYQGTVLSSNTDSTSNNTNNILLIFGILALPLAFLTIYIAQKTTRRKRNR